MEKVLRIVMKEIHNQLVLEQEEKWRKREKQNWLELGDKNTRFFHQMASARKRNNTIETIKEGEITLVEHKQKAAAFHKHFIKLIGTQHRQQERFDYSALYTHEDLNWDQLHDPITMEELQSTIANMPFNKAPGPDGYTAEFFKKFSTLIAQELLNTYNSVISSIEPSMSPLNDSYIVLIPKKQGLLTTDDFRPISLINSIQKIFSKIMANRLRNIIQSLILPNQTGFLQNRSINEGFLYAQELVTMAKREKKQVGLFKADIYKAFDTLSWVFLAQVMEAKGFPSRWISIIQGAVLQGSSKY